MEDYAELLHSMFCLKPHPNANPAEMREKRMEDCCYFYVEATMENSWEREDRKKWLAIAKEDLDGLSEMEADSILRETSLACKHIFNLQLLRKKKILHLLLDFVGKLMEHP